MAIFGSFGAHRGPKMACSNLFRPKMTFPHLVIVIFSKKRKKIFFLNLTTLLVHSGHAVMPAFHVDRGLLLYVIVREGSSILKPPTASHKPLSVWIEACLAFDHVLDALDRSRGPM